MPTLYDVLGKRLADHERLQSLAPADRHLYIPTGLRDWDRNGGVERSVLTMMALPSGDGKSHVALHLVREAAKAGYKCVLFSFEDPWAKTADRQLAGSTGISSSALAREEYDVLGLQQLRAAVKESEKWAKLIDVRLGLCDSDAALEYVESGAGRNTDLRVYDYAQAFNEAAGKSMERTIASFAWECNRQAQEHNAACVVMAQTVPDVEERGRAWFERNEQRGYPFAVEGYRPGPGKSDVTWCKAVYERAKACGFGYRPGRWARKHRMKTASGKQVPDDRMEIWWDKVSFGNEGAMVVGFDGAHSRLYDLEERK